MDAQKSKTDHVTQSSRLLGSERDPATGSLMSISTRYEGASAPHVYTEPAFQSSKRPIRIVYAFAIALSLTVPLAALVAWLASINVTHHTFDTFAGEEIGGMLSQGQAKAIDVVCGALLAPLVMTAANTIWFNSARVSAVNEQQTGAIPLRTLVAASTTASGSYDLLHFRDLLQGKTWRLCLLALLTLFSALARTSLTNIIAYEAFSVDLPSGPINELRLQRDAAIEKTFINGSIFPLNQLELYDFSISQQGDIANQITGLLTQLSFENITSGLTDGAYIGINATRKSLDALLGSVRSLHDVPGYRLTVDCTPDLPDFISVLQALGPYTTQISLTWNTTDPSILSPLQVTYPGVPEDIQTGDGDGYTYVGFSIGTQEAYLGTLNRFNLTNDTSASAYGDVHNRAFDMSAWGFSGTQSTMSVSGLRCSLHRQAGLLNLTRSGAASAWAIAASSFSDARTRVPSLLAQWQSNLNYHAPQANIPGIGPPLSRGWGATADRGSFDGFAANFLYASGEVLRATYEVAAANATRDQPEYLYVVDGTRSVERYRITYVPSILLAGLACLVGAGAVTAGLAWAARASVSGRAFRQVDAVRVVVDGAAGLGGARAEAAQMGMASNDALDAWAGRYKVRYEKLVEGDGEVVVRLVPVGGDKTEGRTVH
ncbi:hypothetical protein B0J12DRAFT_649255 [Macrophomina phaseolina]|uniref:Uncharacterized protein n=1 Tax=Macrophomina phaseolina TaxID=35725 RepID=A0ABQ8GLJ1_9PEZI|nr:hypothetical protein B0J12DRAFT_649255 [Macrophomina phaseolina]